MFTFTMPYSMSLKLAKKLAHSAGSEETRYYLCGFYVHKADDGRHYAVSTNGHILTRMEFHPVCQGDLPAVIFPSLAFKQIEGLKPSNKQLSTVTFRVDAAAFNYEIECEGQKSGGRLIDGNYPDYTRVIPCGWRDFTNEYGDIGLSPIYLAAIMKAASYHEGKFKSSADGVRMFFEKRQPAVITETKDDSVLYVIMPTVGGSVHEHKTPDKTLAA